jgi:hypothetical protein
LLYAEATGEKPAIRLLLSLQLTIVVSVGMIVRLSVVIGMRVVVASVIRLPVVGVIVHVTVMAMFVFMHVLVKMIMGVDMVVFVGVGFFPRGCVRGHACECAHAHERASRVYPPLVNEPYCRECGVIFTR